MWMDPDDARSDFVLAAAAAIFAPLIAQLVSGIPGYPLGGILGAIIIIAWSFAGTGLVPLLLARHRGDGASAFGLTPEGRAGLVSGLLLAVPVVLLGIVNVWSRSVPLGRAVFGVIGEVRAWQDPVVLALVLLQIVAMFAGLLLLFTFLAVRARHAFARNEMSLVEALRTYGMGAVGAVALLGLLRAIGNHYTLTQAGITAASLAAVVLLTDRLIESRATTTAMTVIAPAATVMIVILLRLGGLFSSALLDGLFFGALAAAISVVATSLVETPRHTWATVPLFAALALYPSIQIIIAGSPVIG